MRSRPRARAQILGVCASLFLGACGSDPAPNPADAAAADAAPGDAADAGGDAAADLAADLVPTPPSPDPLPVDSAFDTDYTPLGDKTVTTLLEVLRPMYGYIPYLDAERRPRVPVAEFGALRGQPGELHLLRDQLALPADLTPTGWQAGKLPESSRSALYGFVFSDCQMTDSESPALVAKNKSGALGAPAFREHGALIPQLLDALIRTANRFAQVRPFDVVISLGDSLEDTQQNELEWWLKLVNGGTVSPDSGVRDDVVPGPGNDANDPFIAEGFAPGTPWIEAVGNHDILVNGMFPAGLIEEANASPDILTALLDKTAKLGLALPGVGTATVHPAFYPPDLRGEFRIKPQAFDPQQLPDLKKEVASLHPKAIPPDPGRAALGHCGFIERNHAAAGVPAGHGFSAQNVSDCTGWYTYEPVAGLPLRIVSLDFGPVEGGSQGILTRPHVNGELDTTKAFDPRYDQVAFLDAELAKAAKDHVALIVLSHQPSDSLVTESLLTLFENLIADAPLLLELWHKWVGVPAQAVDTVPFRQKLAACPHVIAHFCGHTHHNAISAICPDGSELQGDQSGRCKPGPNGETGYWEVTSAAVADHPHQGRLFEIVHIAGRQAALYLTVVDARIPPGSFAELGRFIARAVLASSKGDNGGLGLPTDRNVLLPLALSADVAGAWTAAKLADTLESESTLRQATASLPPLPVWSK